MLGVIVLARAVSNQVEYILANIFKQVTVDENSSNSACGIKEDDSIYCWGFGTCNAPSGTFCKVQK